MSRELAGGRGGTRVKVGRIAFRASERQDAAVCCDERLSVCVLYFNPSLENCEVLHEICLNL